MVACKTIEVRLSEPVTVGQIVYLWSDGTGPREVKAEIPLTGKATIIGHITDIDSTGKATVILSDDPWEYTFTDTPANWGPKEKEIII